MEETTLSFIFKGEPEVVSLGERIYKCIGTAEIVDLDNEKLLVDDILSQVPDMIQRGGGRIPITLGHKDAQVGGTVSPHVTKVIVMDSGKKIPALEVTYKLDDLDKADKEAQEMHENNLIKALSISGFYIDTELTCTDEKCSSMHRVVKKGNYRSFALCSKPRNRLAMRLDQPGAPEVIRKALELEDKTKCSMCTETSEYYQDTHDLSKAQADAIVQELLVAYNKTQQGELGSPEHKEDSNMELEDLMKAIETLALEVKGLQKADPEPIVEPVAPEPVDIVKFTEEMSKLLEPIVSRLDALEKAEKPEEIVEPVEPIVEPKVEKAVVEPVVEDDSDLPNGVSPKGDSGIEDMSKGALQPDQEEVPSTGEPTLDMEGLLKEMPDEWGGKRV